MNAVKNAKILALGLKLEAKRIWEYKINFAFDLVLRISEAALFFAFWAVILGTTTNFAGWDMKGFLLIFAFESYFISIMLCFAYACVYLNQSIHKAELDNYLSKPASAWVLAVQKNISLSWSGILAGTIALILAVLQGIQLNPLMLAVIFLMIILGAGITCLFGLSLASLSFWLGRIESIESVFESFWSFQGRPANIFPPALQALTALTFPFIFTQTIPALAVLEKISFTELLTMLGLEILALLLWYFVFKTLWNKGLKRYESGGG